MKPKILLLCALIFVGVRVFHLTSLPMFNDEAIYLDWGQQIFLNANNWKLSLVLDGKQPGYFVVLGLVQQLPIDPLIAGRVLSIVTGLATFFFVLYIARRFFDVDTVPLALLLCFTPFVVFFDRMALTESMLTLVSTLVLLLFLQTRTLPRYTTTIALGLTLLAGWLLKSTINLLLIPMVVVAVVDVMKHKDPGFERLIHYVISIVLFVGGVGLFLLNPYFRLVQTERGRLLSLGMLLHFPIGTWMHNFLSIISWLFLYGTPLVFAGMIVGALTLRTKKNGYILLLWCCTPLLAEILLMPNLTARYIAFIVPPLLICAAATARYLKVAMVASAAIVTAVLIFSPLRLYGYMKVLPSARTDFAQYVIGWTSGYGVREAADWVSAHVQNHDSIILTRADSGNPEDAMHVYLQRMPHVRFWVAERAAELPAGAPVYFVTRGAQYAGLEKKLHEVAKFPKPLDDEFVGIYTYGAQ